MKTLTVGLVFKLAVNSFSFYGQVLKANGKSILVVVFKGRYEEGQAFSINEVTPLLIANTFSARFKSGDWIPVVVKDIFSEKNVFPTYKIEKPDGTYLVNFTGEVLRKLKPKESNDFFYESHVSPIRLEKAIDAYFNNGIWKEEYDKLLYRNYFKV